MPPLRTHGDVRSAYCFKGIWLDFRLCCCRLLSPWKRLCAGVVVLLLFTAIASYLQRDLTLAASQIESEFKHLAGRTGEVQRLPRAKNSSAPAPPHNMAAMIAKIHSAGGFVHSCLGVASCAAGPCMRVLCEVPGGQPLMSVPVGMQLFSWREAPVQVVDDPQKNRELPCPHLREWLSTPEVTGGAKEWHLEADTLQLAVRLSQEQRRGASSPWATYIATLPASYHQVVWDEAAQHRCLTGTPGEENLHRRFLKRSAELRMLKRCNEALGKTSEQPASSNEENTFTENGELMLDWVSQTASSRAFSYPGTKPQGLSDAYSLPGKVFVPLADLFTSALVPNADWRWNTSTGAMEVVAARTVGIEEDEDLTFSYGRMTNEQLLIRYGIAHFANPFDVIYISLMKAAHSPAARAARLALSWNADVSAGMLPKSIHALRLHQKLSRSDKAVLLHVNKNSDSEQEVSDSELVHKAEELATLSALAAVCREAAQSWNQSAAKSAEAPCRAYRNSLAALANTCVSFAAIAHAEVSHLPGNVSVLAANVFLPSDASASDPSATAERLVISLLNSWRAGAVVHLPLLDPLGHHLPQPRTLRSVPPVVGGSKVGVLKNI
eukprot:TRINITY_DN19003_c0_g1_i1.p1 TRINITY_DN19003_c0_g1~~TRINITY_DN19003_c0_g1_i1.p1  ORF type:complete len:609 (-),score=109.64 TRINITY_DN19003_c0_g1_i1:27-1853(-)